MQAVAVPNVDSDISCFSFRHHSALSSSAVGSLPGPAFFDCKFCHGWDPLGVLLVLLSSREQHHKVAGNYNYR